MAAPVRGPGTGHRGPGFRRAPFAGAAAVLLAAWPGTAFAHKGWSQVDVKIQKDRIEVTIIPWFDLLIQYLALDKDGDGEVTLEEARPREEEVLAYFARCIRISGDGEPLDWIPGKPIVWRPKGDDDPALISLDASLTFLARKPIRRLTVEARLFTEVDAQGSVVRGIYEYQSGAAIRVVDYELLPGAPRLEIPLAAGDPAAPAFLADGFLAVLRMAPVTLLALALCGVGRSIPRGLLVGLIPALGVILGTALATRQLKGPPGGIGFFLGPAALAAAGVVALADRFHPLRVALAAAAAVGFGFLAAALLPPEFRPTGTAGWLALAVGGFFAVAVEAALFTLFFRAVIKVDAGPRASFRRWSGLPALVCGLYLILSFSDVLGVSGFARDLIW